MRAFTCAARSASTIHPILIPFLLLDDFRNDVPEDYLAGFPWHPHRGIETITYVLAGTVEHGDSIGNRGAIAAGDIQWMTAGRGIIHQEMPKGDPEGRMHGFQLWANLPASLKMTEPRYQEVKAPEIPEITDDDGTRARVVCGTFWGKKGPIVGIAADPVYIDVSVPPGRRKTLPVEITRHAFAYVLRARGSSAMRQVRSPCRPNRSAGWTQRLRKKRATARSYFSIAATKSLCKLAPTEYASSSFPASLLRSRSRGTARS